MVGCDARTQGALVSKSDTGTTEDDGVAPSQSAPGGSVLMLDRALNLQEAAKRDARSRRAHEQADPDENQRDNREAERVDVVLSERGAVPFDHRQRELLREDQEDDGDYRAYEA